MTRDANTAAGFIDQLDAADKSAIRTAVDRLIELAAHSPDVKNTLIRLLEDRSRTARWPVAYILASLPSPPRTAISILLDTLASEDPDIRWAIALLLIRLAKTDRHTRSRLLDLLGAGDPNQRRMSLYCLRDLNLRDAASLKAMQARLQDSDPLVRVAAILSLRTRSDTSEEGRELLFDRFSSDPDRRVRHAAALTLAHLGASSRKFLDALNAALKSDDPQMRKAARSAMAVLQKKGSVPDGTDPLVD